MYIYIYTHYTILGLVRIVWYCTLINRSGFLLHAAKDFSGSDH